MAIDLSKLPEGPKNTSSGEIIRGENDFVLDKIEIESYTGARYSLKGHFAHFTYEESVFSTPHGSILLVDAVDYPTLLPIIGEERIAASFTRQDETAKNDGGTLPGITFDLPVYTMTGRQQNSSSRKRQTYTLKYVSDTLLQNVSTKVTKAFKALLYSDIVQNIFDEHLSPSANGKPLVVESTKYEQNFLVQNEAPVEAIKKIAGRAISQEEGNGSFYVFYEDRDAFHFTTLSKLFEQAPVIKIRYDVRHVLSDTSGLGHKEADIAKDMYNIGHYYEDRRFDIVDSLLSGHGAGTLITFDPIRRKIEKSDFDLDRDFDSFKHIDKSKRFTEKAKFIKKPLSRVVLALTNKEHDTVEHLVEKDPEAKPYILEDVILKRQSQKAQLLKHVISTTLSGDPRVKAGHVLEFMLPEHMGRTSEEYPEELDKYLQGRYLIISIQHVIRPSSYSMNIEMVKDTFFSDISHRDPVKEYEGIK